MCMGCASNADFIVTSGILGGASLRVAARRFLPTPPRWARRVSDREADAFVAGLQAAPPALSPAEETACAAGPVLGDPSLPAPRPVEDERAEPGRVLAGR